MNARVRGVVFVQLCILYLVIIQANVLRKKSVPETDSKREGDISNDTEEDAVILGRSRIFQDIFSAHLAPLEIQFGHVCENPNHWEQRFEHRDYENNHHRGKVKWGDEAGGRGEIYWDLNH